MPAMTALFAILFYAATAILAVGLAFKVVQYARTPAPLKIPTTPAPVTVGGVALRMIREVVLFESLFKSNKWIWLFGYMFHGALLLAMMRHLRYFIHPVWDWVALVQPFGMYAGFAMLAGLGALWFRRIFVQRIRYISGPSDHLMLVLLLGITGSGLAMNYVARTDIVALKQFMLGLMRLDWQPMPAEPVLMAHLGMVIALMIIFPFSKLLHAPGLFFSPTRNQVDNAREKRHLAPWAAKLEAGGE
ncbi:MAG: respiratory nitrate reductase subunit gamma [Alphaproteobacteria bacterium]|nr:respiratory nitrate reductase subunit gamma [Alphaproteobacteria bacterium]MCK5621228.1 respiratory nitrate reductase subunit gamma [Alphaproteobacteria bacterium]